MPQSRSSRSDEGLMALTRAIFKQILGLSEQTTERMIGIIKNTGQFQDMKLAIRTMSGVSHRRLNDIIDRIEHAGVHGEFDTGEEDGDLETYRCGLGAYRPFGCSGNSPFDLSEYCKVTFVKVNNVEEIIG